MEGSVARHFTSGFEKLKNYVRSSYSGLSEYDAEDIVQQTALNMISRSGSIGDVEHVASYIYSAVRNVAKNFFRKRDKEIATDEVETGEAVSAEEEMINREIGVAIRKAIGMLDEKSQFVFVQTEIFGRSYQELAEETGEPVGTLLSRKSRAVKKLRIILSEYANRQEEEK